MTLTERLSRLAGRVDRWVDWFRLPKPLGIAVLIGLREQLRADNLYDTGRGSADQPPQAETDRGDPMSARTIYGTDNDLQNPLMGSVGSRFGRNVSPTLTYPEEPHRLLDPNPRLISRRLLARDAFRPATTLNLLAAAWIQFEVHDWFSHGTAEHDPWVIPLEDADPWPQRPMTIKKTLPDPSPDESGPPTFTTQDTHWWDGSQIYGNTARFADGLRSHHNGQLHIDEVGLPPKDLDQYLDFSGAPGNFWVGLALLQSLFMREHNAICVQLAREYPNLTDQQLYDKARLVNSALMAKIHTIDWTPSIIAHPTTVVAMRANWFGVLGEKFDLRFGRRTDSAVLQGIPGSPTDQEGVPYSLTEEFVAVYRMHPLMPDDYVFRSLRDDQVLAEHQLPDLTVGHVRQRLAETEMDDLFYSFGVAYPGELSLHNFPKHLQRLQRPDGTLIDLAAADVLRVRERGVLRYNAFRRMFRLRPVSSFEELTDNPVWAEELRQLYGDVERVDLMVGMYAEKKPAGFGFSDTAFRVFILMASRRLRSDRFFTDDFTPEVYTDAGMQWVQANTMRTVLLRHFPALEPTLRDVTNPFAPWPRATVRPPSRMSPRPTSCRRYPPPPGADPTYVPYSDALEQSSADEQQQIDKVVKSLRGNNEWAFKKFHHGLRDAHAKSHAILRGELTICPGLPPELAQGLFATPAIYPVIARLSTTSGVIRSDQIRGVHGLAIKVLDVPGERCLRDDTAATQDFLAVSHSEFPFADVHAYLTRGMPLAWLLARLSDPALKSVTELLAAAKPVLDWVKIPLPSAVNIFIEQNTNLLGQPFYSAAPIRWGDYVAKFAITPLDSVRPFEGQPLPPDAGPDAYRDMLVDFFAHHTAEYELCVQLCTDLVSMPIEDATVAWPESASPHVRVATLTYPIQNPYTPERQVYGDDVLSFNSWRGLDLHRPLGPINRLKLQVYEASSRFRHEKNNEPSIEPTDVADLPE